MGNDRTLAIGWDVGGWKGRKQAVALLELPDEESEVSGYTEQFSMTDFDNVPVSFEKFIEHFDVGQSPDIDSYDQIVVAIDSPLGLPEHYLSHMESFQKDSDFNHEDSADELYQNLAHRETDRYIHEAFEDEFYSSWRPQSPSMSWMANLTSVALSHCQKWKREQFVVKPTEESGVRQIIEVYPKLMKVNGKQDSPVLDEFCNGMEVFESVNKGTHQYDAAISAIHARALMDEEMKLIKPEDRLEEIEIEDNKLDKEGWIYHFEPDEYEIRD